MSGLSQKPFGGLDTLADQTVDFSVGVGDTSLETPTPSSPEFAVDALDVALSAVADSLHHAGTEGLTGSDEIKPIVLESDENNEKRPPVCPIEFREIEGHGVYTVDFWGPVYDINNYINLISLLESASENDIFIMNIDSPGGRIDIGTIISSAMERSAATVVTVAVGQACSISMHIWSCGNRQQATDDAIFMYHMSSHGDSGNSVEIMDRAANIIEYVMDYLLKVSLDKGHLKEEEYVDIRTKGKEIWLDGPTMRQRLGGSSDE